MKRVLDLTKPPRDHLRRASRGGGEQRGKPAGPPNIVSAPSRGIRALPS